MRSFVYLKYVAWLTDESADRLTKRLKEMQANASSADEKPIITFDKDDVDTLDFVTATANLRATIFHLEANSKFNTKRTFISRAILEQGADSK